MHVIIVGCGRVGSGLAVELTEKGNSVAVVDRKPEAFRRLPSDFSGTMVPGVGFDRERLIAAGVEHADALAAVTSGDNSNILTARVAREAFGVERVVARIYDTKRADDLRAARHADRGGGGMDHRPCPAYVGPGSDRSRVERPDRRGGRARASRSPRSAGHPLTELEAGGLGRIVAVGRAGVSVLPDPTMAAQEGDVVWVAVPALDVDDYDRTVDASVSPTGAH